MPPSAAVRQRSIAVMSLSGSRQTGGQPRRAAFGMMTSGARQATLETVEDRNAPLSSLPDVVLDLTPRCS